MTYYDDPSWTNAMHAQVCVVPTRDKVDSHVFLQNKCSLFTLSIAQQIRLSLYLIFFVRVSFSFLYFPISFISFHTSFSSCAFKYFKNRLTANSTTKKWNFLLFARN